MKIKRLHLRLFWVHLIMATKEEIYNAFWERGVTATSWARVRGINHNSLKTYIDRFSGTSKKPNGDKFREIEQKFKEDFGFSIRDEN